MKRLVAIVALLAGLAACNTVEGVGEDISDAARTVRSTF
jgi:predicted small secreted protein